VTARRGDRVSAGGAVVVAGGTSGIGREVAAHYAERGVDVVLTGRDEDRARSAAAAIGGSTRGVAMDLAQPDGIAPALAEVGPVKHLVIAAIERDENTVRDYAIDRATRLAMLKLVGYTEVVHALSSRIVEDGSIVLFGGLAKERPYVGSTTVSTVNGAVTGMVRAMALELAPVRVNAVHPGFVVDSPYWAAKPESVLEPHRARTPIGRLVTMREIVDAVVFLLENTGVNGVNLNVDGGWLLS
jgi:NAD(P)-dependent dehydrogenase (short-subunit alcohol dehydrogenase family)